MLTRLACPTARALLFIEEAKSPFSNPLLNGDYPYNDQCSVLSKSGFGTDRTQNLQAGAETRRVWEWSLLQCCALDATRQHTTYTLSPRKTRKDTQHSRALGSPLDIANLHTAVFDENPCCIGLMAAACVSKSTQNVPLMTVCKRVLCWRLTQIIFYFSMSSEWI